MATTTRNSGVKSKKVSQSNITNDEVGGEVDPIPLKNKLIEIYEPEPIVTGVEEKIEEDPLIPQIEDEEGAEEAVIDGEELNPFGDRWEE
jgi:hypothetical protein